jgi:hypothetical protein
MKAEATNFTHQSNMDEGEMEHTTRDYGMCSFFGLMWCFRGPDIYVFQSLKERPILILLGPVPMMNVRWMTTILAIVESPNMIQMTILMKMTMNPPFPTIEIVTMTALLPPLPVTSVLTHQQVLSINGASRSRFMRQPVQSLRLETTRWPFKIFLPSQLVTTVAV